MTTSSQQQYMGFEIAFYGDNGTTLHIHQKKAGASAGLHSNPFIGEGHPPLPNHQHKVSTLQDG